MDGCCTLHLHATGRIVTSLATAASLLLLPCCFDSLLHFRRCIWTAVVIVDDSCAARGQLHLAATPSASAVCSIRPQPPSSFSSRWSDARCAPRRDRCECRAGAEMDNASLCRLEPSQGCIAISSKRLLLSFLLSARASCRLLLLICRCSFVIQNQVNLSIHADVAVEIGPSLWLTLLLPAASAFACHHPLCLRHFKSER